MATANTPPKPEDYGLTSDRVEWLFKHLPKLGSWEQEDKRPLYVACAAVSIFVGGFAGIVVGVAMKRTTT